MRELSLEGQQLRNIGFGNFNPGAPMRRCRHLCNASGQSIITWFLPGRGAGELALSEEAIDGRGMQSQIIGELTHGHNVLRRPASPPRRLPNPFFDRRGQKGPLFRSFKKGNKLITNPLTRTDVLYMIKRRARAAGLQCRSASSACFLVGAEPARWLMYSPARPGVT
jgi:hypothetical protein